MSSTSLALPCLSSACESDIAKLHVRWSDDIILPNQLEPEESTRSHSVPPEVFRDISLYTVSTNGAQLWNGRQTSTYMLLVKNLEPQVLSCACFSKTFFHFCPLQENTPSHVWPRTYHQTQLASQRNFTLLRKSVCMCACMYVLFTCMSVYHKHTHRHQNIGSMGTGVTSGSV